jgi:hypothetical protein
MAVRSTGEGVTATVADADADGAGEAPVHVYRSVFTLQPLALFTLQTLEDAEQLVPPGFAEGQSGTLRYPRLRSVSGQAKSLVSLVVYVQVPAVPADRLQVRPYPVVVCGDTFTIPESAPSVSNPVPTHTSAFAELQERADELPWIIDTGFAESEAVGAVWVTGQALLATQRRCSLK